MRLWYLFLFLLIIQTVSAQNWSTDVKTTPAHGLGAEEGVMRRDPSDIIKVEDQYYVWYTKGRQVSGYNATIWYAISSDGHKWVEMGEALPRGPIGSWDEQSVFTPNILVAEDHYWLFYTAVPKPFYNSGPNITKTAIGIAVSNSPEGPWKKLNQNPILKASDDPRKFDSMRVDDACLIFRNGKYWLYFKGRQWDNTPGHTKMGVAIADHPGGPYVKYEGNPIIQAGHEVLVWPYGKGIVALISNAGPKEIAKTLQYTEDGINFRKMDDLTRVPSAPGAYRPEAFLDSGKGKMIAWGIHIGQKEGFFPFLERFDCHWKNYDGFTQRGKSEKNDPILAKKLADLFEGFDGNVGIYVHHLATGRTAAINADELFPTASMIKVPILLTTFDKIKSGQLDYHEDQVYYDSLLYAGEDILGSFKEGEKIKLSKVIMLMITTSDNTASLWCQKLAGTGTDINKWLSDHGFEKTRVNSRTPGREKDREIYGWGQTTPREMAELLSYDKGRQSDQPVSQ